MWAFDESVLTLFPMKVEEAGQVYYKEVKIIGECMKEINLLVCNWILDNWGE